MSTTLAIRFPLGRYHATPWGRAVNEGKTEWPPSPWRLMRALVATWHTRWPDLPAADLEDLLGALGDPPSYRTPPVLPGHTRHYLPDLQHRKGGTDSTDLTLDPFLATPRDEDLLVRWEVDLPEQQRQVLAKLAELLPYLGRAESLCDARLLDEDPVPDETWWRATAADDGRQIRLLAATPPISRTVLEASTADVRKQRRTTPRGTAWLAYSTAREDEPGESSRPVTSTAKSITALRFAVTGSTPLKVTNGVLLADETHRLVGEQLKEAGVPESERTAILGSNGATTDHQHAHWIPLSPGSEVGNLVIWVPRGLPPEAVAATITMPVMSGRRSASYKVRGFPELRLIFQAAGTIEQVAPELCHRATTWRSLTPYLPVRHRKRETVDAYLTADLRTELHYRPSLRDLAPPAITPLDPGLRISDRWSQQFRRYRMTEPMSRSRPGLGLRLEFDEPIAGPLLLGQLSHFGYGVFIPEEI